MKGDNTVYLIVQKERGYIASPTVERSAWKMGKIFNVSADCKPSLHYMVNLEPRLREIKDMVDKGQYFTIHCPRQYGKTTTLRALGQLLEKEYVVVSLDFQLMGASKFKNENTFSIAFAKNFIEAIEERGMIAAQAMREALLPLKTALREEKDEIELFELFQYLSRMCSILDRPVVLIVDEVDSATNNQVFLDFLAQLRGYYINRDRKPSFQSVILAGVYDVKNIQQKIRPNEEHKVNSPWNIAADFLVDMSFSVEDIAGMLAEYEEDHRTGMELGSMAELIYAYTSGYPFLVSRICKLLDERIAGSSAWTKAGFLEAMKLLLEEPNTLFESLVNKLEDYPELNQMLHDLLFQGKQITYGIGIRSIEMALMFGFLKKSGNSIWIANRIFETLLYNRFLASPLMQQDAIYGTALKDKNQFLQNGHLNMNLVLERFVTHFDDLYGDKEERFYEDAGRCYFLLYLMPIINGTGNYYIESRTRNMERTDVIVDYRGEQFVIEMKIWHGNAYNARGEKQLLDYLAYYHLNKGYMLSFNFNKKKEIGVHEIVLGDKRIVEAVV